HRESPCSLVAAARPPVGLDRLNLGFYVHVEQEAAGSTRTPNFSRNRCKYSRRLGLIARSISLARQFDEAGRELGTSPSIFMLEKHVGFAPALRPKPLDPIAELLVAVVFAPQTHVAPRGGADQFGAWGIVGVGDAQRARMGAKATEHVVVEPALVSELERRRILDKPQESFEPREILLEIRRQLKQQRPAPVLQGRRGTQKLVGLLLGVLQPLAVRDGLRRLEHEPKSAGRLCRPRFQHALAGHAVK